MGHTEQSRQGSSSRHARRPAMASTRVLSRRRVGTESGFAHGSVSTLFSLGSPRSRARRCSLTLDSGVARCAVPSGPRGRSRGRSRASAGAPPRERGRATRPRQRLIAVRNTSETQRLLGRTMPNTSTHEFTSTHECTVESTQRPHSATNRDYLGTKPPGLGGGLARRPGRQGCASRDGELGLEAEFQARVKSWPIP